MLHILKAEYVDGLQLRLQFSDGAGGIVDLTGKLEGPVFRLLNDPLLFREFAIVGHTVAWSNGADLAPEYLRGLLAKPRVEQRV